MKDMYGMLQRRLLLCTSFPHAKNIQIPYSSSTNACSDGANNVYRRTFYCVKTGAVKKMMVEILHVGTQC